MTANLSTPFGSAQGKPLKDYYPAKELAGLPGMPGTERSVQRMADREAWPFQPRVGRGGGKEYALASLPAATIKALTAPLAKIAPPRPDAVEAERNRLEARTQSLELFGRLPLQKQRPALAKLAIIKAAAAYIATHRLARSHGQVVFCHEYNLGRSELGLDVRECIPHLSPGTLRTWIAAEYQQGMVALVDMYGNRRDQGVIETWNAAPQADGSTKAPMAATLVALLLHHPGIKDKAANEALRGILPEAPYVNDKTVGRFLKKWIKNNPQQYALAKSPDDYKNKLQPAFGSRSEGIDGPNQRWEIDATPADLLLTDGDRYKIIGVCDVGPRRLKYYVTKTEKAADNAFAVRNCLLDWGVPKHGVIVTDQGSAYIGAHFTRVLSDLEIDQHICQPFSGDEKPHIERSFRTFSHDLIELTSGYCGHNVADRKEIEARKSFARRLMDKKEVIGISVSAAELQTFVDRWVANYHNTVHSSISKTPNQAVAQWPHPIYRIEDERALDILLAEAVRRGGKLPIIGKKGIRVNGGFYVDAALHNQVGAQCRAFQDQTDLGKIIVHIRNSHGVWEFLCIATDHKRLGISLFEVAQATSALHKEHKKEISRLNREAKKEIKGIDIVDKVMTYREEKASAEKGNVSYLPRPSVEYTTPGLQAAAEAAAVLDGRAEADEFQFRVEQIEAAKERWIEMTEKETKVVALPTAARPIFGTDLEKYKWLKVNPYLTEYDDAGWMGWYEHSKEYRLMFGTDEEAIAK